MGNLVTVSHMKALGSSLLHKSQACKQWSLVTNVDLPDSSTQVIYSSRQQNITEKKSPMYNELLRICKESMRLEKSHLPEKEVLLSWLQQSSRGLQRAGPETCQEAQVPVLLCDKLFSSEKVPCAPEPSFFNQEEHKNI